MTYTLTSSILGLISDGMGSLVCTDCYCSFSISVSLLALYLYELFYKCLFVLVIYSEYIFYFLNSE
jgi:hypothetical protein